MIDDLVRPNIKSLKPYTSARDMNLQGILLDANENSLGSVLADFSELELNRYPDPNQRRLRKRMSEYLNLPQTNIFFGVGSDEIIDLLIRIFAEPGRDAAVTLDPTYGMYKVACDINNVKVNSVLLSPNFNIDFENLKTKVTHDVKIIFACSPNNPTGKVLKKDDIKRLAETFDSVVIIDEAYIDFSEENTVINEILEHENLVVLRTFSKAWGLAGLRCGYCAANEKIIDYLYKVKAPYNLNKVTQSLIMKAIDNAAMRNENVVKIKRERERVKMALQQIKGVRKVFESDANFILFKIDNAVTIQKKLSDQGIVIRDRSNQPLLDDCLRVTVGTVDENNLFLDKLGELTT